MRNNNIFFVTLPIMKNRFDFILLSLSYLLAVCTFISCDGTKHLADDELLLVSNQITTEGNQIEVNGLQDYIIQKPNTKWFSTLKVPLGIYSLSGRDTTKFFNRLMRKWGEKPVALDSALTLSSTENLRNVVMARGFLDAHVDVTQNVKNRRVKQEYRIFPDSIYRINDISYYIADKSIDSLLKSNGVFLNNSLQRGDVFSIISLQEERRQVSNWLNNNGYRYFNKEMITYDADTSRTEHIVNLRMNIGLFRRSSNEMLRNHPRFKIRNISYVTPEGTIPDIRYKTLDANTVFQSGDLYSEKDVQKTYNKFARLQYIKSTNVTFQEIDDTLSETDDKYLDATVVISKRKKHSIQIQPEGTNTAGDLGAAILVTYDNRNVFRGCEMFSLQARAAFEAIRGLEGYSDNNYEEYGIETKLTFPMLVVPGISRSYHRRHTTTTDLVISYNLQNRPEFHRRVMRGAWRYNWNNSSGKVSHKLEAIDLNFVSMPWISATFKHDYLESSDTRNAILKYSYENLLIMKTGYSISYNDGVNSVKASVETAGNLLNTLGGMFRFPTDEEGKRKVAGVVFAQYIKTDIDYTHLIRFDAGNTLALHSRIGIAYAYGNSNIIPYEKRYFSGGANSVRGWGVRELGPGRFRGRDGHIDFINQTGDVRIDLNAELRSDLFWKFQGAVFIDAGNIWNIRKSSDQPSGQLTLRGLYEDLAVAYGVGLRLNFDYFILRLDLGMKAINPVYTTYKEHFPIAYPKFSRDKTLHFAVGLPF